MVPVAGSILSLSTPVHANLWSNGGFEDGRHSQFVTPTGWTSIGHTDGVIPYKEFATPAYEGDYFYDFGGFGDSSGPVGDGIGQTVATTIGTRYQLTFGLSSEDVRGNSTLRVSIGGLVVDHPLTSTGTFLGKGFTTQMLTHVATSTTTTIDFIEVLNDSGGNDDPLIDGVVFDVGGSPPPPATVPEPISIALLGAGPIAGAITTRRRKTR